MQFRVPCECGEVLVVNEGSAGQKLPCPCGRIVAIPRFGQLKALAGVEAPELAPDFVIEQLLLAGKLPHEDSCVSCGVATDQLAHVVVECERAQVVQTERSWFTYLGIYLFSPLLALYVRAAEGRSRPKEYGKDKTYSLPVRLCPECKERMVGVNAMRRVLDLVPDYRKLLVKYPKAVVRSAN